VDSWRAAYRGIVADAALAALDAGRRGREWLRWITEPGGNRHLVAERWEDGAVLGMASVGPYRANPDEASDPLAEAGWGELWLLYLVPEAWGTGVAGELLAAAEAALVELGYREAALWVFEANPRARRFYEHHGWVDDGHRLDFEIGGQSITEARYRRHLAGGDPPAGCDQGLAAPPGLEPVPPS
jgi:GNAT superfamily N-acetyltransferase